MCDIETHFCTQPVLTQIIKSLQRLLTASQLVRYFLNCFFKNQHSNHQHKLMAEYLKTQQSV